MRAALRVEGWKLFRSRVPLVAALLLGLGLPSMGLGFYTVALRGGTGILADKAASFLVAEGWVGYLRLVDQIAAVAAFLGVGVVVAWVFGREHADRTFAALFSLAVSRASIAAAKFSVLIAWALLIAMAVVLVALALGMVSGVGAIPDERLLPESLRLFSITVGASLLALTMALVASWGRGYLPAIGALIVIVAVTQVAVLFGTGEWFPYAIPGLMAVVGGAGVPAMTPLQIGLVPLTALAAVMATLLWWRKAQVV